MFLVQSAHIELVRSVSYAANASTDASPPGRNSSLRLPPGNDSAMLPQPVSNGCSQPKKPEPKWVVPTLNRPARRKSHNHCAELLVPLRRSFSASEVFACQRPIDHRT